MFAFARIREWVSVRVRVRVEKEHCKGFKNILTLFFKKTNIIELDIDIDIDR